MNKTSKYIDIKTSLIFIAVLFLYTLFNLRGNFACEHVQAFIGDDEKRRHDINMFFFD